jgi:hypothetical protein
LGVALGVNNPFLPEIIVEKLGVYIMEEQRANEKEMYRLYIYELIYKNLKDLYRLQVPHYE